ncbi:MAG: hypothetical protein LBL26_13510, partial [Peptococcaceae bacterium]|nr:hypothetical protein [Peptococcaceae bacterium]
FKWDLVFNALSEEQRSRVLELALRLMPTEPPEPEDLEAIEELGPGDSFVFTSAKEIADYFGIAE